MKIKGKLFRKIINIADRIDCWFRETFNRSPKQKALELSQESMSIEDLDKTIGMHIKIKPINRK